MAGVPGVLLEGNIMSRQNSFAAKQERRGERADRKAKTAQRIPFAGVITTKRIVMGARYNALHDLAFSPSAASVRIAKASRPARAVPSFNPFVSIALAASALK